MNIQDIIQTVQNVFIGADNRDWDLCLEAFANEVVIDYTSMHGGEPASMYAEEILEMWQGFLPKFAATHHQLGNYTVHSVGEHAEVYCYGTSSHFYPNQSGAHVWNVYGTYNITLQRHEDVWKVTVLKFNFKFADGNLELPSMIKDSSDAAVS